MNRGARISLNHHVHLCALFQLPFVAIFVMQRVFDANFSIKIVGIVNGDFGLFGHARMEGLDYFSHSTGFRIFGFWPINTPGFWWTDI